MGKYLDFSHYRAICANGATKAGWGMYRLVKYNSYTYTLNTLNTVNTLSRNWAWKFRFFFLLLSYFYFSDS